MGKPRAGAAFIRRALSHIEELRGQKAKDKQEEQFSKVMEKARQVKLPKRIKAPTDDYIPRMRKRRAHSSTLLKKGMAP